VHFEPPIPLEANELYCDKDTWITQPGTLTTADGRRARFIFKLFRDRLSARSGCWLVRSLAIFHPEEIPRAPT